MRKFFCCLRACVRVCVCVLLAQFFLSLRITHFPCNPLRKLNTQPPPPPPRILSFLGVCSTPPNPQKFFYFLFFAISCTVQLYTPSRLEYQNRPLQKQNKNKIQSI